MSLSLNNQLDLYGGGPRQQKKRGFVTVNEPAKGFFATGSIWDKDGLAGNYIAVRRDTTPGSALVQKNAPAEEEDSEEEEDYDSDDEYAIR